MKLVHKKVKTVYIIQITEAERKWLMLQLQNPLHGLAPNEEELHDSTMRYKWFKQLKQSAFDSKEKENE